MQIKPTLKRIYGRIWVELNGRYIWTEKKTSVEVIVAELMDYDVVSFDIFDTLIRRLCNRPTDLFYIVGDRIGIRDFADKRIRAEQRAREEKLNHYGNSEVNIFDIYRCLIDDLEISIKECVNTELEVELDYCYADPFVSKVYDRLKNLDRRIIITSDMYLPSDMMQKLLDRCGYCNWSKLFVSCDEECNKHSGKLYRKISRELGTNRIIHIGDNLRADVLSARKEGWEARYYTS